MTELVDPLEFLRAVWKGELDPSPAQVKAAAAALPYVHPRKAPGKKEDGAPRTGGSKYAARQGPRLVSSR
ncbi:hypothetical protein [Azohydromonas lata]|uniref:hypothetical protein n=1 Tax=Azohydromonas lata TaxID=45677 RepID=UPI00082C46A7|nr:hypothetical protein [Azohydromonas lata]